MSQRLVAACGRETGKEEFRCRALLCVSFSLSLSCLCCLSLCLILVFFALSHFFRCLPPQNESQDNKTNHKTATAKQNEADGLEAKSVAASTLAWPRPAPRPSQKAPSASLSVGMGLTCCSARYARLRGGETAEEDEQKGRRQEKGRNQRRRHCDDGSEEDPNGTKETTRLIACCAEMVEIDPSSDRLHPGEQHKNDNDCGEEEVEAYRPIPLVEIESSSFHVEISDSWIQLVEGEKAQKERIKRSVETECGRKLFIGALSTFSHNNSNKTVKKEGEGSLSLPEGEEWVKSFSRQDENEERIDDDLDLDFDFDLDLDRGEGDGSDSKTKSDEKKEREAEFVMRVQLLCQGLAQRYGAIESVKINKKESYCFVVFCDPKSLQKAVCSLKHYNSRATLCSSLSRGLLPNGRSLDPLFVSDLLHLLLPSSPQCLSGSEEDGEIAKKIIERIAPDPCFYCRIPKDDQKKSVLNKIKKAKQRRQQFKKRISSSSSLSSSLSSPPLSSPSSASSSSSSFSSCHSDPIPADKPVQPPLSYCAVAAKPKPRNSNRKHPHGHPRSQRAHRPRNQT